MRISPAPTSISPFTQALTPPARRLSHPLGDFLGSTIGDSGLTNSNWVNGVTPPSFLDERMYGISQVLYVTAPEPSSLLLAGPAIIVGCACGWSRRRRETHRTSRSRIPTRPSEWYVAKRMTSEIMCE